MRVAVAALFLLGFAVAGCGGGGTLSAAAYSSHAAAICEAAAQRSQALPEPTAAATKAEARKRVEAIVVNDERTLDELAALKPDPAFATTAASWVAAMRTSVGAFDAVLRASVGGKSAAAAVARGRLAARRAHDLAAKLEVLVCLEGEG